MGENLARQQTSKTQELEAYLKSLNQHHTSMFLHPTTNEILTLIKNLPNKRSSGYDNISNLLLKSLATQISVPLEIIFNKSIEEGIFPTNMKKADIVPLYKQECSNYNPIKAPRKDNVQKTLPIP